MELIVNLIANIGVPLALILIALITGTIIEKHHFSSIHRRELALEGLPLLNTKACPTERSISEVRLVTGTVVISYDFFKRFLAGLRLIFGGEVKSYVSLIDRARREAVLRMKEKCANADMVINLRIETSSISKGRRKRGIGTVEVIAYGTALWYSASSTS